MRAKWKNMRVTKHCIVSNLNKGFFFAVSYAVFSCRSESSNYELGYLCIQLLASVVSKPPTVARIFEGPEFLALKSHLPSVRHHHYTESSPLYFRYLEKKDWIYNRSHP